MFGRRKGERARSEHVLATTTEWQRVLILEEGRRASCGLCNLLNYADNRRSVKFRVVNFASAEYVS